MQANSAPVRVIMGDDSGFIRILLSDYLRQDEAVELVATGTNGYEVAELTVQHQPDVVITDLIMPEFDGLYAVQSIMKRQPTPIVLLSSLSRSDPKVFEALSAGAVEFMGKPKGQPGPQGAYAQRFLSLIKTLAGQSLPTANTPTFSQGPALSVGTTSKHVLVVMGASTGGPAVLENLLRRLPAQMPVPLVIAQHMPASFLESFAARLNQLSALTVSVAKQGQTLQPGQVYLAAGQQNLIVEPMGRLGRIKFVYTDQTWSEFNEPSIDGLFHSAAQAFGNQVLGVLLTGMGKDGGQGLAAIRKAGGCTLAQDESSSVVYGMPRYAQQLGAVMHTITADTLPHVLLKHL